MRGGRERHPQRHLAAPPALRREARAPAPVDPGVRHRRDLHRRQDPRADRRDAGSGREGIPAVERPQRLSRLRRRKGNRRVSMTWRRAPRKNAAVRTSKPSRTPMRKRQRLIAAASVAASLLAGLPALAAGCGPGTFEMADGMFFQPSTGRVAASCDQHMGTAPAPAPAAPAPEPAPVVAGTARAAVERARTMLLAHIKEENEGRKPDVVTTFDVWVDVTLAVWNSRTDEIRLIEMKKNGFRVDAPEPVKVKRNNGVNSEFLLENEDDVVVGVRYPIFRNVTVSARKPRYELVDVHYVPYSARLHTPEMVAWGKETLDANVKEAYDAYRAAGIRSRAFPDRLLVDVISKEQLETIAVIEHLSEG